MNQVLLFALLSHSLHGFNISQLSDSEDVRLHELGLLDWVEPTHSTPGFYELSDKGRDALKQIVGIFN